MSKVTQTTQAVLMIEPKYFIYVTSFSSLNLSLIIWGSIVSLLPSLIKDKTVMKMMEQSSSLDSAFHLHAISVLYLPSVFITVTSTVTSILFLFFIAINISYAYFHSSWKIPHSHCCQSTPFFIIIIIFEFLKF